ncbi:hypothetical protein JCM13664_14680 [Methylothermus subterraneus]
MRAYLFAAVGVLTLVGSEVVAVSLSPPGFAAEPFCPGGLPKAWRNAQTVEGVEIQEERVCWPDNPSEIAAFVKGTNRVAVPTLMNTPLAADAVVKENDRDGDGDPDEITLRLEIAELNGSKQEGMPEFEIAPKLKPALWVFSPKRRLLAPQDRAFAWRFPSPVIRVEAGDKVRIILENTHYLPHTFKLFGVDHPFVLKKKAVPPGQSVMYEFTPRQPGTMFYQSEQPAEVGLGLVGMFVVEENRPNNWMQTFNLGAGKVRHPAKGILEQFDQEYDLQYQALDDKLSELLQRGGEPEQIAERLAGYAGNGADYALLNGRLYPYNLRESPIITRPNQVIKLRLFNAQSDAVAIAFEGHRVTITHYDGVEHHPLAQVMRDVLDLAPGQRLDLRLLTSNDGLHAFGPGVWGISGRSLGVGQTWRELGAIVYDSFLGREDTPSLDQFAQGETWPRGQTLPAPPSPSKAAKRVFDLFIGGFLGLLAYVLFSNQKRARELIYRCLAKG